MVTPGWLESIFDTQATFHPPPHFACSRVALSKVIEVSEVTSFSLSRILGSSGSVLLFTWCLFFCKTRAYYKNRVRICTFLKYFCVYCYVDLAE